MLESLFPRCDKRQRYKIKKRQDKRFRRIKGFAKRKGCYVVDTGYTRCKLCEKVQGMHRLGCSCSNTAVAVEYGGYMYSGNVLVLKKKRTYEHGEWISYKDLKRRLIAGDRFIDATSAKPVTLKNF